jgi:hypothetical protein
MALSTNWSLGWISVLGIMALRSYTIFDAYLHAAKVLAEMPRGENAGAMAATAFHPGGLSRVILPFTSKTLRIQVFNNFRRRQNASSGTAEW